MKKMSCKNLVTSFSLITALLAFSNCKKDELVNPVSNEPSEKLQLKNTIAASNLSMVTSSSFYLERALPSGYVKDGSRDYTSIIQSVISQYPNIVFPGFPIMINDAGLRIPSNRVITFLEGSQLRLKPSDKQGYSMLDMNLSTNVTLVSPVLVGDRYNHRGTTGEWGMGISSNGASNITILSPKAKNMWGDGIYIGSAGRTPSRNIVIKDAYLEYNRRDGITITSVIGLKIENAYIGFSNGTLPMSGIAFEPNRTYEEIQDVVISNPRTVGNLKAGIFLSLGNLMGGGQKKIDVTVYNHTDLKSKVGFKCNSKISDGSSTIQGDLTLVNPVWSQNELAPIQTILYGINDVHLIIKNPVVRNMDNQQLTKIETDEHLNYKTHINRSAYREITYSTNWPIAIPTSTTSTAGPVIAAISAGSSTSFTASNGITYQSDRAFSGGGTHSTLDPIDNTSDDKLYQSERFGTFGYAIPVSNGTYEVTLKFAEIYFNEVGSRKFDALIEGSVVLSDLDILTKVGYASKYDVVKTISVTDGTLNLKFNSDINNAKLSAFHIIKK